LKYIYFSTTVHGVLVLMATQSNCGLAAVAATSVEEEEIGSHYQYCSSAVPTGSFELLAAAPAPIQAAILHGARAHFKGVAAVTGNCEVPATFRRTPAAARQAPWQPLARMPSHTPGSH
jgi:hypothetical protein